MSAIFRRRANCQPHKFTRQSYDGKALADIAELPEFVLPVTAGNAATRYIPHLWRRFQRALLFVVMAEKSTSHY
jgi:hypothetical protein